MLRNSTKLAATFLFAFLIGDRATAVDKPLPIVAAPREIDLKDFKVDGPTGSPTKPKSIANRDELADAFPDRDLQAKIAGQVDFGKEILLYFSWAGSGDDKLSVAVTVTKPSSVLSDQLLLLAVQEKELLGKFGPDHPEVNAVQAKMTAIKWVLAETATAQATAVFQYVPSGADSKGVYHRLFVLPKNMEWKVEVAKEQEAVPLTGLRVIRAEATVELRGLLVHTPKGVFMLVKESHPVGGEDKVETVTWELDLSKLPDAEKLAKELSGKVVMVLGTCPMDAVPPYARGEANNFTRDPKQPVLTPWEMKKVVAVSKLSAVEKK